MSTISSSIRPAALHWDIFCKVIDNFGDIGVCWRLSTHLAALGHHVRLWVDDPSSLQWIAPGALTSNAPRIDVRHWTSSTLMPQATSTWQCDVLVEGFGCDIPAEFLAHCTRPAAWLNLEYLSAENYVERNHGLASPVMQGPAQGWQKHFFYPGFTAKTGGLLREQNLLTRQAMFDRGTWLQNQHIAWQGEQLISLFCYEPPALAQLVAQLNAGATPTTLLVTHGRASQWVQRLGITPSPTLSLVYLPPLSQVDFDHLLWACDFNCVRGEDSLVRAIWADKPFVWQIYPQDDHAHHEKLDAFLDFYHPSPDLQKFHYAWNNMPQDDKTPELPPLALTAWQDDASQLRSKLLATQDLATQLLQFALKTR